MVAFLGGWCVVSVATALWLGPVLKRSREMHEQFSWQDEDETGFADTSQRTPTLHEQALDAVLGLVVLALFAASAAAVVWSVL
jgi:hypothetical protein